MFVRTISAAMLLIACSGIAYAQDAPAGDVAEAQHFSVVGLAPDDLLNLRATASATGMLIGRLQLGAVAKNLGCAEVEKTLWCKVADLDNGKVQGWAAARYLQPAEVDQPSDIGPVGEEPEKPAQ